MRKISECFIGVMSYQCVILFVVVVVVVGYFTMLSAATTA
jgi:hypothetical protein